MESRTQTPVAVFEELGCLPGALMLGADSGWLLLLRKQVTG